MKKDKILNVKDVLEVQAKKQSKRSESFDHILDKCHKTIKRSIEIIRNNQHCFFEVPEFLIGYPLYDLNECIQYIVQKLTDNGFYVKYFFPRVLYISWAQKTLPAPSLAPPPIQQTPKKKGTQQNKNVKMTTKQKGKFVLDLT